MEAVSRHGLLNEIGIVDQQALEFGDLLLLYLQQLGVDYVFGVPGGAIEPFYNALARSERRGGPRAVVSRHETGAAFMAHGYYSNSGRLGVCCATTGPGATNLLTGVASAYENHVPLLVITAQTALSKFGHGAFQESSDTSVNTTGMFQFCTRYNTLISHPDQFERKVYSAIMTALQLRTPVHLSVPMDIFQTTAPISKPSFNVKPLLQDKTPIDDKVLQEFVQLLTARRKIVFVIGDECADSIGTILSVAILLQADIVTTPHGKGMVSPYHPNFRGVIGFSGHQSADSLLTDPGVDLIVAIGTSLGEWTCSYWDNPEKMHNRLVHVESNASRLSESPAAMLHVLGDLSSVFESVLGAVFQRKKVNPKNTVNNIPSVLAVQPGRHFTMLDEQKCHETSKPIKPQRLMYKLTQMFPPQTFWLADVGSSFSWSVHYLHPQDRRLSGSRKQGFGSYRSCFDFAPMGWAIGSAIGIALARPNIPVVCITGDGSWLMNGQEVTVALQEKLTVIYVILNDSALGMVKHGQVLSQAEQVGFELPEVSYSEMARAQGIASHIIQSDEDLLTLNISAICSRQGPTVLDIRVDGDEVPPMHTRISALKAH